MAKKKNKNQELSPKQKHAFDNAILEWTAPPFRVHEKTKLWYFIAGLILLALIIHAIITDAWTFAVALVAVAYVYVYSHRNDPKSEKVIISEIGIKEGEQYYPYSCIKGFWIIYHPPHTKQLHFITSRKFVPEVVIQLADQNPVPVRNFLCSQIPEIEGQEESFVEALIRTIKL